MPRNKQKIQLNPPLQEPEEEQAEGTGGTKGAEEAEEAEGELQSKIQNLKSKIDLLPTPHRLATQIEAILYLKGKPLSVAEIAEYAGCDRPAAEEGLIELIEDYARRESALEVVETHTGYSLQLRSGFQDLVHRLIPLELGVGALRTLAAIALHNPIAQNQLVELRGSSAYQHVQELVEQGFVRKRRQPDSRSSLLQLTEKFHQYFQVEQLPQLLGHQAEYQQLELDDEPLEGSRRAEEAEGQREKDVIRNS
jgi:segregation and condensation protein B